MSAQRDHVGVLQRWLLLGCGWDDGEAERAHHAGILEQWRPAGGGRARDRSWHVRVSSDGKREGSASVVEWAFAFIQELPGRGTSSYRRRSNTKQAFFSRSRRR